MRLEQLQYIVEIAQSGSFSMAADRLHISQPSLSIAISSLEKELGVTIFTRSRQGAQLTEMGETIVTQAREILIKIDQMSNTNSSILMGNLSVSAVPSVCLAVLPEAIATFKNKHPHVKLTLNEQGTHKIIKDVNSGKSDLGIIALPANLEENDPHLKALEMDHMYLEKLYYDELVACVGKKSPLSIMETVDGSEIAKYPFVCLNSDYLMPEYITKLFGMHGDIDMLLTTGNSEIAKRMVVQYSAIGFFSKRSLKEDPYVRSGDIFPLQISNTKLELFYGCIRKNRHFSTTAQEFVRILKSLS